VTLYLIENRDAAASDLSVQVRDALFATILRSDVGSRDRTAATAAVELKAALGDDAPLEPAERALLGVWLDRLAR